MDVPNSQSQELVLAVTMTEARIVSIDGLNLASPSPEVDEILTEALSVLRSGQLMILPIDTSYVFAVDAENSAPHREVKRLRQVKDVFAPTIIVGDFDSLTKVCLIDELSDKAREMLHTGLLSIVLPTVTGSNFGEDDVDAVVVNMPSNPMVRALLERFGVCQITAAGIAGSGPTLKIQKAVNEFGIFVDLYWDMGILSGINTTIVDLYSNKPKIIRRGGISSEALFTAFPNLEDLDVGAS